MSPRWGHSRRMRGAWSPACLAQQMAALTKVVKNPKNQPKNLQTTNPHTNHNPPNFSVQEEQRREGTSRSSWLSRTSGTMGHGGWLPRCMFTFCSLCLFSVTWSRLPAGALSTPSFSEAFLQSLNTGQSTGSSLCTPAEEAGPSCCKPNARGALGKAAGKLTLWAEARKRRGDPPGASDQGTVPREGTTCH